MNKERLMTVLIQPHVSEKAATVAEKANQYVFRVRDDASKAEVKQAVELMFEVKVEGVNLLNRPGNLCASANRPVHRLHRHLGEIGNRPWHSSR
jgi:ribosomal protein L23